MLTVVGGFEGLIAGIARSNGRCAATQITSLPQTPLERAMPAMGPSTPPEPIVAATSPKQNTGKHSPARGGTMETIHTDLAGLHRGELDGCSEVWLAQPQQCLWRAVQVVSHEMMSEGTHEQNLRRVYVHTSPLGDAAEVERQVRQRIRESGRNGEFHPQMPH